MKTTMYVFYYVDAGAVESEVLVQAVQLPHTVVLQEADNDRIVAHFLPYNPRPAGSPVPHPGSRDSPFLFHLALCHQTKEYCQAGARVRATGFFHLRPHLGVHCAGNYEE